MKTAISIPDTLFKAAERLARQLHLSRSELYQRALVKYIGVHDDSAITDKLNQIYEGDDRGLLDPGLDVMQRASLDPEDW